MLDGVTRAKAPARLPVVLSKAEVLALLDSLTGIHRLLVSCSMARGCASWKGCACGLRMSTLVAARLSSETAKGRRIASRCWRTASFGRFGSNSARTGGCEMDLRDGYGSVWLPHALARKYPSASREWGWQYVFPADRRVTDPRSG